MLFGFYLFGSFVLALFKLEGGEEEEEEDRRRRRKRRRKKEVSLYQFLCRVCPNNSVGGSL